MLRWTATAAAALAAAAGPAADEAVAVRTPPANACLDTHGGNGFLDEHDVERKFREPRLYQVAPVSNNLVLAYVGTHVLGLPKSYGTD